MTLVKSLTVAKRGVGLELESRRNDFRMDPYWIPFVGQGKTDNMGQLWQIETVASPNP